MSLNDMTLLCVEDDVMTVEAIRLLLEGEVKALYVAYNGEDGLSVFKEHRPDIVLTDIEMPRMNGIRMAEEIKEIDPHRPVAIITAYGDVDYLKQAANLGINRYVQKPIAADTLFETLNTLVRIVEKTNGIKEKLREDSTEGRVNPFEVALEGAESGFFDWNVATDELVHGAVFDRIFQLTDEGDLQTLTAWAATWHPSDRNVTLDRLNAYVGSKRMSSFNRRVRMRRSGPEWQSISVHGKSYEDDSGNPHFAGVVKDITRESEYEQTVFDQSKIDTVTGLPMYALFARHLKLMLNRCRKRNSGLFLCFIAIADLDRMYQSLGVSRTERVLETIVRRLHLQRRDDEILGRLKNDAFGLTISGETAEIEGVMEEIVGALTDPMVCMGLPVTVQVSVGVSRFDPAAPVSSDELVHRALLAMYEARTNGINGFHFLDIDASARLEEASRLLYRFESAIERDELRLFYQPKVHMRSGRLAGLEALLRWQHPQQGLLSPHAFLPVAERDVGVMQKLGQWVFGRVFEQLAVWGDTGFDTSISINVSAHEFENGAVLACLKTMFEVHPGIDPLQIEIEVLETQAVKNIEQFSSELQACRALGVHVAIDDFGTGYASLNYLKNFPWDTLKIDQSFVRDIASDERSSSIVELSVKLAASFDSTVIAEGVETEECGLALLKFGCELAQGYAISKPLPASEVVEWRHSWKAFPSWLASATGV